MEATTQVKLKFTGIDILNVNFNSVKSFNKDDGDLELDVQPKSFIPEDNAKEFKIIFDVKIACKDFFEMSLIAMGNFEFNIEIEDDEVKRSFINVNAVAIVFPYIRAFISTFTSNLGSVITPIIIPTQFFKGVIEEKKSTNWDDRKPLLEETPEAFQ